MGRFVSPDPLGQKPGLNVYAYAGGDPLNLTDPLGLCESAQCGNASPSNSLIPVQTVTGAGATQSAVYQTTGTAPIVQSVSYQPTAQLGASGPDGQSATPSNTGDVQLAARTPTLNCQNVECGAPTGGVVSPLCPTCNDRLKNGGPPILLENGRKIIRPIGPAE